jgi:hypothetical protein
MDLSSLKTVDENTLTLKHPVNGEALTADNGELMQIVVYGVDSDRYRKVFADIARELGKNKKKQNDPELYDRATIKQLAGVTKDIKNVFENNEEVKDAMYLYKTYPWIKEQVAEFVEDRENFLPK